MSPDTLDDWAVCQILIDDAIEELYRERPEQDRALYEPWCGLFSKEPIYSRKS
jgi:hypothetical protein